MLTAHNTFFHRRNCKGRIHFSLLSKHEMFVVALLMKQWRKIKQVIGLLLNRGCGVDVYFGWLFT
jgi:hypothetical protein